MQDPNSTLAGRKFGNKPAIPIGIGLTTAAFMFAAYSMYKKRDMHTQWGLRLRVAFQGFTLGALLWYSYKATKEKEVRNYANIRKIDWNKLEQEAAEAENAKTDLPKNIFSQEKE
ncbi:hypothetical protein BB561_003166 [Smittium simulii]|uniref:HIG1 domain-containing protein n=1 Tax=Smittium simulii TaxID=133385 RepID=A0A2T9YMU4_9FUNG|nr:hypothetical protein BB561_003166 [Smittium simulii]